MFGEISSAVVVLAMLILAVLLTKKFYNNHKAFMGWWAFSFWLAFLAAAMDLISYINGSWSVFQFRVYLFTAASLVAYMGAGTVYLLSEKYGKKYVVVMTLIAMAMIYSLATIQVVNISEVPAGQAAQEFVPKGLSIYFMLLSGIGAMALFLGAVYSWFKTRRNSNLWIAVGALVFSAGGAIEKYMNIHEFFYICQALGAIVLFIGVSSSMSKSVKSAA